jgi:ATP-binding protein involved in chromosome partitioning
MLHGNPGATAGSQPAQGHASGREISFAQPGSKTRPILVSSGKGGVGKSSVTTNLAVALAAQGYKVGIVDADIYGYSIPRMLGTDRDPVVIDNMLLPPEQWGVRCISIGYFVPEGQAVVWRGPMLHKALEQFLTDVFWDEPDFLLIDMPPGTGDVQMGLARMLPRTDLIIVTTPAVSAQKVAIRAADMARRSFLRVAGVIENMSTFTCDHGNTYELFGNGGGQALASEIGSPLLGNIPIEAAVAHGSDTGEPIVLSKVGAAAEAFAAIAQRIISETVSMQDMVGCSARNEEVVQVSVSQRR